MNSATRNPAARGAFLQESPLWRRTGGGRLSRSLADFSAAVHRISPPVLDTIRPAILAMSSLLVFASRAAWPIQESGTISVIRRRLALRLSWMALHLRWPWRPAQAQWSAGARAAAAALLSRHVVHLPSSQIPALFDPNVLSVAGKGK